MVRTSMTKSKKNAKRRGKNQGSRNLGQDAIGHEEYEGTCEEVEENESLPNHCHDVCIARKTFIGCRRFPPRAQASASVSTLSTRGANVNSAPGMETHATW